MSCHDVILQEEEEDSNLGPHSSTMNTSALVLNRSKESYNSQKPNKVKADKMSAPDSPNILNRSLQDQDLLFSQKKLSKSRFSRENNQLDVSDLTEKKNLNSGNDNTLNLDIILQSENSNNQIIVYGSNHNTNKDNGSLDEILTNNETVIRPAATQNIIINVNNHNTNTNRIMQKVSMLSSGNNTINECFEPQSRNNSIWDSFRLNNASINHRISDLNDKGAIHFNNKMFEKKMYKKSEVVQEEIERSSADKDSPKKLSNPDTEEDFIVATDGKQVFIARRGY